MTAIEDWFTITDDGLTFDVLEDEDGGTFWCYGHVEPEYIVHQVNRWLLHLGAEIADIIIADDETPTHHWAKWQDDADRFELRPNKGYTETDNTLFPVTRLML